MSRQKTRMMVMISSLIMLIMISSGNVTNVKKEHEEKLFATTITVNANEYTEDTSRVIEIKTLEQSKDELSLTEEEIRLIALVTMAEAEGECEEGQRLVIDTILNRVDSPYFPDTVSDVIYQPNQFTSMWNDRLDRCYVSEDMCQLVRDELISRLNYDVIFFNANHYSKYGVPLFQVENHYFSSYD